MQAVILAGGLGTRLSSELDNIPKPMVDISGRPFLSILIDNLIKHGVDSIILSVGYKHEKIIEYFGDTYKATPILYSIERSQLGTGGAIKKAIGICNENPILVLNGDSYFAINFNELISFHEKYNCDISVALKYLKKTKRYGTVIIDKKGRISKFKGKNNLNKAYINCGTYIINKNLFSKVECENNIFSFEKDILENNSKLAIHGFIAENYFIDIGIPSDLKKARQYFEKE